MNSFVDTHCHLDMILEKKKLSHLEELLPEFGENFEKALHIACDESSLDRGLSYAEQYENIYLGAGIHPHDAKDYNDAVHNKLLNLMKHPKVVAWGECGLDYHYDNSPREIQKEVFLRQINAAQESNKPLIVHTREAEEDTWDILSKNLSPETKVHIHCFTSAFSLAQKLLDFSDNIYFGFTGVITFPSAEDIRQSVLQIPLERILLETDSPFMAPKPHRGKPAHPGHIPHIAEKVAEIKEIELKLVYKQCRQNTKTLYGI